MVGVIKLLMSGVNMSLMFIVGIMEYESLSVRVGVSRSLITSDVVNISLTFVVMVSMSLKFAVGIKKLEYIVL